MSTCSEFLDFFDYLVKNCKEEVVIPQSVQDFYNALKDNNGSTKSKSLFTETGLKILAYAQESRRTSFKCKDIADGMGIPSRKISGAMRKLVTDGFFDKSNGVNPVIYSITEKGINFDIKQENTDNE